MNRDLAVRHPPSQRSYYLSVVSTSMNKVLIGVIIGMVLVIISTVSAHPPSDLDLAYNTTSGNLTATFIHTVADPDTHYVGYVDIKVDGNEILNQTYTSQPSTKEFIYMYPVNATTGSLIEVMGECILGGTKKSSLIL